jgi:hypothetical protein
MVLRLDNYLLATRGSLILPRAEGAFRQSAHEVAAIEAGKGLLEAKSLVARGKRGADLDRGTTADSNIWCGICNLSRTNLEAGFVPRLRSGVWVRLLSVVTGIDARAAPDLHSGDDAGHGRSVRCRSLPLRGNHRPVWQSRCHGRCHRDERYHPCGCRSDLRDDDHVLVSQPLPGGRGQHLALRSA